MTTTNRAAGSSGGALPLIALLIALVALGGGIATTWVNILFLDASLNSPSATAADVYGAQSWILIGATISGAGVVSLIAALIAYVVSNGFAKLVPATVTEVDEVLIEDDAAAGEAVAVSETTVTGAAPAGETEQPR